MSKLEFVCLQCEELNSQDITTIPDMNGFVNISGNLVRLLPTWVKYDQFNRPVRGRTYCTNCYEPKDFALPRGVS